MRCLTGRTVGRVVRDATLLVICWYSLIVSLCMLYVLHTHSNVVDNDSASSNHVAKARSTHVNNSPQDRPGWLHAAFFNANQPKPTTTTVVPVIVTANATDDQKKKYTGYTLLDKDEPLDFHCDRCSLVSSSGHLLNSGAGYDIDSADCVLRMNSASVLGYEEDVGIRTDVRVIGHVNLAKGLHTSDELRDEILGDPATRTGIVVVPWLYQERINKTNNTVYSAARNMSENYPNVKFYFLTPEKINETEERFRIETGVSLTDAKTWLSTGFVAMLFAIDVCNRIDVYGLSNVDYCLKHPNSTAPYHYYEPDIRRECEYYKLSETQMTKGHKFMTEKAVFARWSLGYNIHFHYPSWRATIKNVTAELETPFLQLYKEALQNGTLEQIRKAAPHVRIIRRVKVIRRRVRRPKPKEPSPKNDTNAEISNSILNPDAGNNYDGKDTVEKDVPNDKGQIERAEPKRTGLIERDEPNANAMSRNGAIYPIKRKALVAHIPPIT